MSVNNVANLAKEFVGYIGRLEFYASKPDGTPRKLLDVSKIDVLGKGDNISDWLYVKKLLFSH